MHLSSKLPLLVAAAAALVSTSFADQYTDDELFQSSILNATNFYREEHNATALTWNATSASTAADWAEQCNFEHSGGPTGENLVAGASNVTESVRLWGDERKQYDFKSPGFSEATGHFTQLVWKGTTTVGCGRHFCNGTAAPVPAPGWYVVCEYYPAGNIVNDGMFAANVQAQTLGSADDTPETGVGKSGAERVALGARGWAVLGCALVFAGALAA